MINDLWDLWIPGNHVPIFRTRSSRRFRSFNLQKTKRTVVVRGTSDSIRYRALTVSTLVTLRVRARPQKSFDLSNYLSGPLFFLFLFLFSLFFIFFLMHKINIILFNATSYVIEERFLLWKHVKYFQSKGLLLNKFYLIIFINFINFINFIYVPKRNNTVYATIRSIICNSSFCSSFRH